MTSTERVLSRVYAAVIGAVAAIVAQRLLHGAWKLATGNEPPATNDPTTPIAEASIWAAASTMGMALTQVLTSRVTARHLMDDSALEAQAEKSRLKHRKLKVTV